MDNKEISIGLFLDLLKAFDLVEHNILLRSKFLTTNHGVLSLSEYLNTCHGVSDLIPSLTVEFFLQRKNSHIDHNVDSLVKFHFKDLSSSPNSYITTQIVGIIARPHGHPTSEIS